MRNPKGRSQERLTFRTSCKGIWAVGVLLLASACEERGAPGMTVTDSAGVRLTIMADAPTVYAELDTIPVVSIGGPDASGPAPDKVRE